MCCLCVNFWRMSNMWKKDKNKEKKKSSKEVTLKYQKPKILLIDLPNTVFDNVRSAGFNVLTGTFGSPYKVKLGDDYQPVIGKLSLPNYTEQEIIFIDLTPPKMIDSPEGEKMTSEGEYDWWTKCSRGKIDPRPEVMFAVQPHFDRILKYGGFFIIFAQPRLLQKLVWAKIGYRGFEIHSESPADNWSFLSILSRNNLKIELDFGKEINVPGYDHPIFHFLRKNTADAEYTATFSPTSRIEKKWISILTNKFGKSVGGLIVLGEDSKGRILILPQISKKSEGILTLLREVLPDVSPHLFPHIEGTRWVERDEYELDSILKYKTEKIAVRQKLKLELEELDRKIVEERNKLGFLHGIITKTGPDLVISVKSCLELIGFKQIIDVDEEIREQDITGQRQEDLQVHDRSPTLLLEIKGLSRPPREQDTNQVIKYVSRRMKEWDRTDVRGVSIINHQRNIPALDRDNQNVFTKQQIKDAENNDITISTTWDLFLLIKGMMNWEWNFKAIQGLFYKSGRMSRIPTIYKPIGKIVNYWEKVGVVGVQLSKNTLHKGERVGYIISKGYLEEKVLSLQVENQDVEEAISGQLAGIKTMYSKSLLRKGTTVCTVKT